MKINNIQATKFYDELRTHFGFQTQAGKPIELVVKDGLRADGAVFIGIFDSNNPDAVPLILMLNILGTGRRWINEISTTKEIYNVVNSALLALDEQKKDWKDKNFDFQLKDATDFLVRFMKQVSDFLR